MVESTALEMRHTGNRIVGSNPTLSAITADCPLWRDIAADYRNLTRRHTEPPILLYSPS